MVKAAIFALVGAALPLSLAAQDGPSPELRLTLADAQNVGAACRIGLLAQNMMGEDLSALVLEAVIFAQAGGVERLMLLDLRDLPQGKPRLRQFDLAGVDCGAIGQILINGAATCEGPAKGACITALRPQSQVKGIEVTG